MSELTKIKNFFINFLTLNNMEATRKTRLTKGFKSLMSLVLALTLGLGGILIPNEEAQARLIFTTESEGVNSDAYHLDNDDSSTTYIDLAFGSTLGARLRYDIALTKFIFNHSVSLAGNELLDFKIENLVTGSAPTCDGDAKGRMYYDTTTNKMLFCNGSAWTNSASLDEGSVTTLEILDGTILTADLSDGAVTSAKIGDGEVKTVNIESGAVNNDKLGANAVTTAKILNETILSEDIFNGTIATEDIADLAITNGKLGADAVTGAKILDGTIESADIKDSTITSTDILNATILEEDLANSAVTTIKINDSAVTSAKIDNGTILEEDLSDSSVSSDKIVNETIIAEDLATSAVTSTKILDGTVSFDDIAVRTVATTFTPEYPNFTLNADGTDNTGTLEADLDGSTTPARNFYKWSTLNSTTAQDYDIVVQWAIPENFQEFTDSGNQIELDFKTNTIVDTDNKVDVTFFDTAGTAVLLTGGGDLKSAVANTWETAGITFSTGTYTPGSYVTLKIKMTSKKTVAGDQNPTFVGALKFKHKVK